jgi:hypothetical protein
MEYGKILKRAWDTVWRYRALWLFGAILAMAVGGGSAPPFNPGANDGLRWEMDPWQGVRPEAVPAIIGVAVAVGVVLLLIGIGVAIFRYVAESSLVGMVNEYEDSGAKRGLRHGFRMGWSRTAWRLFLIDLAVGIPVAIVMLLVFAVVAAPSFLWFTESDVAGGIGTAFSVLMFVPALLLAVVVSVVLSVLMRFFRTACIIEGLGVRASIRRGLAVARQSWGNVATTWLIMVGVGIAWFVVRIALFVVLLPVFLLTIVLGAIAGGVPTAVALGIASLAAGGPPNWIPYLATAGVGIAIGLPLFVLVAGLPWFFVNGLMEVFKASVWTQVYRQLRPALSESTFMQPEEPAAQPQEEEDQT